MLLDDKTEKKNNDNKIYSFLKYKNCSCRFDSYMLIQIYIFNKYYEILDKNNTKFEDALKEIGVFIFSLKIQVSFII